MSKYHIPIYGWLVAVVEYERARRAHRRAIAEVTRHNTPANREQARLTYAATWEPFGHTTEGYISTLATLLALGLAVLIVWGV